MSGHVVDAHLMFIKSMHEHNLAGLKDRERGKETERAMPLISCSIDLDKVCILFLDDVVGQNYGHIILEGMALWSQALSVPLFSPVLR